MDRIEYFIVGQGLAGTMLAFEMWKNNLEFRIISSPEKSRASMVAAGLINPLVFKRLTKSWMADDLLPVMKKKYSELEELLQIEFFFEKDILKPLSEQETQLWLEKSKIPEFSKYIYSIERECNINALGHSFGYGKVRGSGVVHLTTFLNAAEVFFRKHNLIIDKTFTAGEINPGADTFTIENISASKIVFCEGYHITKNSWFGFVPLKPVKGEVLLIYAPNLSEEFILNKKVFVLPIGNHRFKVGSTFDWDDLTEMPTEMGMYSIVFRLENLISANYTIENHWAGIRPTVADRRPVLGFHPEFKNLMVFNGLGTKGVMLAPHFAKQMLSLLTIKNYSVEKEVDVRRFI